MCKQVIYLTLIVFVLGLGLTVNVAGASELKINFQSAGAPIPEGYLPEYGEIFFEHDNGWSYGWNQNITSGARDRNNANAPDQRYDTLNHFRGAIWEIEVPNGTYNLYFVCGDPSYTDQTNNIDVEGILLEDPDGPVGTGFDFDEFEVTVEVNDGRLTIQPGAGQDNSKFCFIDIESDALTQFFTKAREPDPVDGAEGVADAILMWTPGDTAVLHRVYLGTDPDAIEMVDETEFTVYWHADGLEPGLTYYWRVDEVDADGAVITGDVWSFTALSLIAWGANPSDGASDVLIDTKLSWRMGDSPVPMTHHVFFGTDEAEVAAGTGDTDKGIQEEATYDPGILQADTTYYFRINEVEMFTNVEREGKVWSFKTVEPGPGKIIREWWFDISGSAVTDLTGNERYPSNPDGMEFLTYFQGPTDWAEQYGSRIRGWIFAPETGNYTFEFDCEDGGELRLSPDESPANAVTIATINDGTIESGIQALEAGNRYYIEALQKENTIGDRLRVSWKGPGIPTMEVISAEYVGATPYLAMKAYGAFPPDGATGVNQRSILSWKPGVDAASHEIYFGTDEDAVKNADTSSPEYMGTQALGEESFDPGKLAWETTYYWRVDEINSANSDSPWTGSVWTFTTGDFITVDDFESYTDHDADGEAIWQHWIDGFGVTDNGAQAGYIMPPYCEQTIVHSGAQSMPLLYINDVGVDNSEAVLTLTEARDWTEEGVGELSLWFQGALSNAAEPFYIEVANANGASALVTNDDPEAALINVWTEWRIQLGVFTVLGVDLTDVDKIAIGLGSKGGIAAGGSGTMYIDDIRLYRP